MSSHREGIFVEGLWTEGAEGNSEIPEVGASSAPLLSASFFFDSQCADFNQDFMICKKQARNDPFACQKEGARVTRCAISLLEKLRDHCKEEWKNHYECLDKNNQMLQKCRPDEHVLNACVFKELGLKKIIPDTPEGSIPIHLREKVQFK